MSEVRIVRPSERDEGTNQTPGMSRAEGVGARTVANEHLWLGHVIVDAGVHSQPHHHGESESGIYIVTGRARFRFGRNLEQVIDAEAGDFVYVPAYAVHQEINPDDSVTVEMVVARSTPDNIVVNVALEETQER
jgi:uncharacterized RmlC-like cupin family protein